MQPSISSTELRNLISPIPRVSLGHFPTPLEFCPRLSEALGGPRIFIKRDDSTGLAFGGNKTRILEFTVGQAVAHKADVVIGGASSQSNHCRQLAAAAAKLGLDCALVLVNDHKGELIQGNRLLIDLLGASVTLMEVPSPEFLDDAKQALYDRLKAEGRNPFVVMRPETRPFGAMGLSLCMAEIADQLAEQGERVDRLVVCSGSTTQPGLMFGNKMMGLGIGIVGVTPVVWSYDLKEAFLRIFDRMAELLDADVSFSSDEILNLDGYIGPDGYGYPSDEGNQALRLMATAEGILLDPIYSAKAMAGLIDLVRQGLIGRDEVVIFVHTGGTPAVFAYSKELGF